MLGQLSRQTVKPAVISSRGTGSPRREDEASPKPDTNEWLSTGLLMHSYLPQCFTLVHFTSTCPSTLTRTPATLQRKARVPAGRPSLLHEPHFQRGAQSTIPLEVLCQPFPLTLCCWACLSFLGLEPLKPLLEKDPELLHLETLLGLVSLGYCPGTCVPSHHCTPGSIHCPSPPGCPQPCRVHWKLAD